MIVRLGIYVLLLLKLIPPLVVTEQVSGDVSLRGLVVSATTKDPLRDVEVLVARVSMGTEVNGIFPNPVMTGKTDTVGRFEIKLPAGAYRVAFVRTGYVRHEYGQRPFQNAGTAIELTVGNPKDANVELQPTGTVLGKVLDFDDQPLAGVPVLLFRYKYGTSGQKAIDITISTVTDAHGDYRLGLLTPNTYYLSVGPTDNLMNSRLRLRNTPDTLLLDSLITQYYPGVTDPIAASAFDVAPGSEFRANFRLPNTASVEKFCITGKLVSAGARPVSDNVIITLLNGSPLGVFLTRSSMNPDAYDPSNQSFKLCDLRAGSYGIVATESGPGLTPRGATYVKIQNKNVESVLVSVSEVRTITGRVLLEGKDAAQMEKLSTVRVLAHLSLDGVRDALPSLTQQLLQGSVSPRGEFVLQNLIPSVEYSVSVTGVPREYYVQSIRLGDDDLLGRPVRFMGQSQMEIQLSSSAAAANGTVLDRDNRPVPLAQVVLIPQGSPKRTDLYRSTFADQNGHFEFWGIAPGGYELFAWEAIEPNSWFDATVTQALVQKAVTVHLESNGRSSVEIRAITMTNRR